MNLLMRYEPFPSNPISGEVNQVALISVPRDEPLAAAYALYCWDCRDTECSTHTLQRSTNQLFV